MELNAKCYAKIIRNERSKKMTNGELAAMIAAIAFAVLVAFLIMVLNKIGKTVDKVTTTIHETNRTIEVITNDVDILSRQVESLLVKSNELLDDVNRKVAVIDPLFTAVADLSQSVSDLNQSSRNLVGKFSSINKKSSKAGVVSKVGIAALRAFRSKNISKK